MECGRNDARNEAGDTDGYAVAAGLSQSFGVYPALSLRAAWVPPDRRWPMLLNALVEKLKRRSKDDFKGRHFGATLILQAVSWYLRYPLSYRDIEELFLERGLEVDHSTLNRWVLAYAPLIERRLRTFRKPHCGSIRVDETSYEDGCVKPVLFSAGRHRSFPRMLAFLGAEVELRAARGALANLVSGGTVSTPRSLIRVGGAPRRAAPLYIIGAVRQPTFRPGRRSLGPTGPVPPRGSGPIRLSVFAGAPPARIPPTMPLSASLRQAGFSSIPCGTAPSWRYRQSAIRSFRARVTIMTLRRRPREPPRRSWNQRESAQPGW